MDEGIADALSKVFKGPFRSGTATPARVPGYTIAGKTGTVPDNKAIWTVGFTRSLAGGGMISYSNEGRFRSYWKQHRRNYLGGAYMKYSHRTLWGKSGQEAGGHIFKPAFAAALKNFDRKGFVEPPYGILAGKKVSVPGCSSVEGCRSVLLANGFGAATTEYVTSNSAKGTFLGISPRVAVRGTSVRILGVVRPSTPSADPGQGQEGQEEGRQEARSRRPRRHPRRRHRCSGN